MSKNVGLKLSTVALTVLLASCGGGGSEGYYNKESSNTNEGTGTETVANAVAKQIRYSLQKESLLATGDSTNLTLVAIDENGKVITNKIPTLIIKNLNESRASFTNFETNDSGWSTTTLTVDSPKDAFERLPHELILEVAADNIKQEIVLPITGGLVELDSDMTAVKVGQQSTLRVTAVDANQKGLAGTVELRNSANEVIRNITTDANGKATATVSYNDIVQYGDVNKHLDLYAVFVASKGGVTRSLSSIALGFTAQVEDTSVMNFTHPVRDIKSNESKVIEVTVFANSQAELTNKLVEFETSLGSITASSLITNIQQVNGQWQGVAVATLNGTGVIGNATIAATFNGTTITTQQSINALTVANLSLQATATTVGVNTSTELKAIAKDTNGYLVKGVKVSFKIVNDPSLGTLSKVSDTTDTQGTAKVAYTAGSSATLSNAVKLQAITTTTSGIVISSTLLNLTIANQSTYISIAEGADLDSSSPTYYNKNYSVNVVDSLQRPLANQIISLSIEPTTYKKGYLTWNEFDKRWIQTVTSRIACNEFSTGSMLITNNISSSGQQTITGQTDASGNMNFQVRYGKNYAWWSEANVIASTTVSSRVYNQKVLFTAPMLIDDVKNEGSPANVNSPFANFTCPN